MPTESEIIKERYSRIEREADSFGRIIGVRRLRMSEQIDINGMFPDLSGADRATIEERKLDDDGIEQVSSRIVMIPHRAPYMVAASVCEITDAEGRKAIVQFPRNDRELRSIMDRLDIEGMAAATTAWGRLADGVARNDESTKNLLGTPSSDSSAGS